MYAAIDGHDDKIRVFTTRIDTIYGATFMVLAPEHDLVNQITTDAQRTSVNNYVQEAINRSERERIEPAGHHPEDHPDAAHPGSRAAPRRAARARAHRRSLPDEEPRRALPARRDTA